MAEKNCLRVFVIQMSNYCVRANLRERDTDPKTRMGTEKNIYVYRKKLVAKGATTIIVIKIIIISQHRS
jgi:hypothetical protein